MIFLLRLAGLLHFLVAGTNFFAAFLFRYRENMAHVEPFVREVFWVQNAFIVLTTLFFGTLCLLLPHELINGSVLSHFVSGFLSLFWLLRLIIQIWFYDRSAKRRFPVANWGFTLVFGYLTLIFGAAAFAH